MLFVLYRNNIILINFANENWYSVKYFLHMKCKKYVHLLFKKLITVVKPLKYNFIKFKPTEFIVKNLIKHKCPPIV